MTRVAVLRDTAIAAGSGQLGAIQSAATQLGMELRPLGMRDAGEVERGIAAFASEPCNFRPTLDEAVVRQRLCIAFLAFTKHVQPVSEFTSNLSFSTKFCHKRCSGAFTTGFQRADELVDDFPGSQSWIR